MCVANDLTSRFKRFELRRRDLRIRIFVVDWRSSSRMMQAMNHSGMLFVFEGPDGVGKTTLAHHVYERLRHVRGDCIRVAFPGSEEGSVGKLVHQIHHNPSEFGLSEVTPASLQFLHVAAHIDLLERVIVPALRNGRVVVLDRCWWSTYVYGREAGIEEEAIQVLLKAEMHFWQGVLPNTVFVVSRSSAREGHTSYAALAERYDDLSRREERRYPICQVINEDTIECAVQSIWDIIAPLLGLTQSEASGIVEAQLPLWENAGSDEDAAAVALPIKEQSVAEPSGPDIIIWDNSVHITEVFDTYWRFAAERQAIFFRRFAGEPWPWTDDAILREHKFTNAYRACDRVSQFLIREVIQAGDQDPKELFFRIMLFKIFNRIDTWRYLESEVGSIRWADYSFDRYNDVLDRVMAGGRQIYSAAYIMPSARAFGRERKHSNHLLLLEQMMAKSLPFRLRDAKSMNEAFLLIRDYHSIGDFLAYQYVTDLNYSELTAFREDEFVVAGPGARDGIRKCFRGAGKMSDADMIKKMAEVQEAEFERLGISFQTLWGRRLQYIDCQNLFCEVDKYARVFHPKIMGISGRTRIKQKFAASAEPIRYVFPKKWGINDRVSQAIKPATIGSKQMVLNF